VSVKTDGADNTKSAHQKSLHENVQLHGELKVMPTKMLKKCCLHVQAVATVCTDGKEQCH